MPPKKKKQQHNGFSLFMLEKQEEMRLKGRKVSMQDMVPIAHPEWKSLPAEVQKGYTARAKEKKFGQGTSGYEGKLDCTGQLVTNRFSVVEYLEKRRRTESAALKDSWSTGQDITHHRFYMIAVKTLCQLPDDTYLPCELACVEYTMSAGITKRFHCFPAPGKLPLGCRYLCKRQGEDVHKIPAEWFDQYNHNYKEIWTDLIAFINPQRQHVMPALFCELRCREEVEYTLEWLARNAGMSHSLRKVYETELLILELFRNAGEIVPSRGQVSSLLASSAWDYIWDTRCAYHEETEVTLENCALGTCNKYCYCLSEAVCAR
ncbi:protein maelstrom homolog isoform X2 [Strongylocentrotus purpuratus]|uniref:Protein maelstrom homolog n=1 Tax=Strongylocentrotus purpuratus TaxID=7668 RepID=A0A7M7SVI0_STRPU|nr:protein maelstrom homolog isoform X2 [Strongylocentrotus purpuratus]